MTIRVARNGVTTHFHRACHRVLQALEWVSDQARKLEASIALLRIYIPRLIISAQAAELTKMALELSTEMEVRRDTSQDAKILEIRAQGPSTT